MKAVQSLKRITLSHGAGGSNMHNLIKDYVLSQLGGKKSKLEVPLDALDDAAVIQDIVFTTDSHTVKPLFFPGGDIGRLAVAGTVNDIAVIGAEPIALSSAFVIEEGFPLSHFEKITRSMKETCEEAGVPVITGDTKTVEKGALDQLIVNTSAVGRRSKALDRNISVVKRYRSFRAKWLLDSNLRAGDKIIVSGTMGDHGVALLSFREGYSFGTELKSDVAPLNKIVEKLLRVGGITSMKDPTRGGLSNTLNEWCTKSKVGILVQEEDIPISTGVAAACEMLGIDPLEIGNEGKLVIAAVPQKAEEILEALRKTKNGRKAEIIGEVTNAFKEVVVETSVGGRRLMPEPVGDPVPRIC
jgi:hydrogenase expression/formation protein HypE